MPISQEKFLSNPSNKNRFISTLMQKLENFNIIPKQSQDNADVVIIVTAIEGAYAPRKLLLSKKTQISWLY